MPCTSCVLMKKTPLHIVEIKLCQKYFKIIKILLQKCVHLLRKYVIISQERKSLGYSRDDAKREEDAVC